MPAELFKVKLTRDNPAEKWGFAMTGGKDQLLVISEVCKLLLLVLLLLLRQLHCTIFYVVKEVDKCQLITISEIY